MQYQNVYFNHQNNFSPAMVAVCVAVYIAVYTALYVALYVALYTALYTTLLKVNHSPSRANAFYCFIS